MNVLVRRQAAIDATKAKFELKPFAWGSVDCVKMIAFHLRRLGKKVPLSKAGNYKNAKQAVAALKKVGYQNLSEAMTGMGFQEIPLAFALPGDVVSFPSDHAIGALGIFLGDGNMLAFHEDHATLVVMTTGKIDKVWKAL